ncbi:MAG: IPExxxVDY family protein [Flavobacteriaceae bacterium]|nr:IPExxxVDY family protein [Flavobacteriaceae bacterium]
MIVHKLLVDDFKDGLYSLLAIHCALEDYQLGYLLNKHLNLNLKRKPFDLDSKNQTASYAIYECEDRENSALWHLVSNICKIEEFVDTTSDSLFDVPRKLVRTHNLIPEYKRVNYLLKIDADGRYFNEKTIINKIQEIKQIATVYSIDVSKLKSKVNLIFN